MLYLSSRACPIWAAPKNYHHQGDGDKFWNEFNIRSLKIRMNVTSKIMDWIWLQIWFHRAKIDSGINIWNEN